MPSDIVVLIGLLIFRCFINLPLVQTFFVADEFWQSTDVAYKMVYGHYNESLTWEWSKNHAIRSPIYPILLAISTFLPLRILGMNSRQLIQTTPRVFHVILVVIGDYYYYKYTKKHYPHVMGPNNYNLSYLIYLTNWLLFYMAPRCIINTVELVFIILIAYHDNNQGEGSEITRKFLMVFISLLRPTSFLFIFAYVIRDIFMTSRPREHLKQYLWLSVVLGSGSSIIDICFYQDPKQISQINFILFNFLSIGANFYGVHHGLWYLIEGLPTMMTVGVVPLFLVIPVQWSEISWLNKLRFLVPLITFSMTGHKEVRFLLPLLPVICELIGYLRFKRIRPIHLCFYVLINSMMAIYLSTIHQVGPISTSNHLARITDVDKNLKRILILTPCHTIPPKSYLHRMDLQMTSLSCNPHDVVDEADQFFDNIEDITETYLGSMPKYQVIVLFEKYSRLLDSKFISAGYTMCQRIFHSQLLTHSRHDNYLNIWCLQK